jgi:hypothetical protein
VPAVNDVKYAQAPDPCGWDVCVCCQQVADDFNCTETGPITDIHFWISWLEDYVGDPNWDISIYDDVGGQPGLPLWTWNGFGTVTKSGPYPGPQGWICPSGGWYNPPPDHWRYYKIDIDNIRDPFTQQTGTTYWLVIKNNAPAPPCVGWKTSKDHFRKDAMYLHPGAGWQELFDPCTGVSLDMAFEITTGHYSHPNNILWEYAAHEWDEVLVGYDKHPHEPDPDRGTEPVFLYSVRLPRDTWFVQDEPNQVYWFGVVAVYDGDIPEPNWGWTNHKHVYNDDAVEGYLDEGGPVPAWEWHELYDQTRASEDLSFILFTEPGCFPLWYSTYSDWLAYNKPLCWCNSAQGGTGDYQCDGDADLTTEGVLTKYRVSANDMNLIIANWKKKMSDFPATLNPCADVDHKAEGILTKYRVSANDLNIVIANWKMKDSDLPGNCPRPE